MPIYALSDLHLSHLSDKPMDLFGGVWENHTRKIEENWGKTVSQDDTVLVCGDISWAMREQEAMEDLYFLNALPGRKILCEGNHDYWWSSTSRLNGLFSTISFLRNNHYFVEGTAICGSRGWVCPNDGAFSAHDEKIYKRELGRVRLSLESAARQGAARIILMLHYPPTNEKKERSGFIELIEAFGVTDVVYGHLHTPRAFQAGLTGKINGVTYHLTSADYLSFMPVLIA